MGEVLAPSIDDIMRSVRGIGEDDTFLDIGAGLGNDLAQVAL